ncbi:MAG: endonuclease [Candidatus Brennerbacteria bacterium CG11_big_fil_rev_8_21_14_0_20_43_10]|uniref:Endonuclease n=3 Tax=Candidatus Brenneribacteriota TaxID=1817902 RepID=A0A2M8C3I8_9BACT|nr:MAG: endonuclease [Candidatus Brennerbacteria bacterium CG23_combo_of_CG06-09_8_20_14_all_44_41]PIR26253.1 MAG: endonuclease [Candidatus Brennerbacteria bacterium CG11_big_fil_rev_8_21_14_0_20_43_10]PIX29019.1 MAG: endonuclease [Candidatus Brennerbacteria bacterium CG_4_8_14_3_um_filter_43_14]PJB50677.1 MAG: endonuclease [Candidatus Brennerbacteria bacterium CG_4_9_14_3_um_filter_43_9]
MGITANLLNRVKEHNSGEVQSTKAYRPWKLIYRETFDTKTYARRREIYLKKNYLERKRIFDAAK